MSEVGSLLSRWMLFVDGENLTFRAQKLADREGVALVPGRYFLKDTFVWLPSSIATLALPGAAEHYLQPNAIRAHYYTSVVGDEEKIRSVKNHLWEMNFQPTVFKKRKQTDRSKGVDIALTTDLLSGAYNNNFDRAVLVAGDGDYVPLINEVKRLGKVVHVLFFENEGLSDDLCLASDYLWGGFEQMFLTQWRKASQGEWPSGE